MKIRHYGVTNIKKEETKGEEQQQGVVDNIDINEENISIVNKIGKIIARITKRKGILIKEKAKTKEYYSLI